VVHIITTVTIEYETVKHGVVVSGVRLAGNDEVLDADRRGMVWASPEAVNDIRCVAYILQRDANEATPFPISDHYSSTVFGVLFKFYCSQLVSPVFIFWRFKH
jgi:hypothetical protein